MSARRKPIPVPWPDCPGSAAYTCQELQREARNVARAENGRLLDWRIVVSRDGTCLQVRYLLSDGIARCHRIAL
jgi:hypothetical protein